MTATLVFGGTFDPVHLGHIGSARALIEDIGDARVVMVPCKLPAHRPVPSATAEDRLMMLQLATEGSPIEVDGRELPRQGTSYTADTLSEYRAELGGDAPLVFVMGSDAWATLPSWYRWSDMLDLAHILIMDRPGSDEPVPEVLDDWSRGRLVNEARMLLSTPAGYICHVTLAPFDVSATEVRRQLSGQEPLTGLLDHRVENFIRNRGLYGCDPSEDTS